MTTNSGRPRIGKYRTLSDAEAAHLRRYGDRYREAREAAEQARLDLNAVVEGALLDRAHYLDVAQAAGISKKMPWSILKKLPVPTHD